jgi:acyl-CoA synthetase (AMP-forming)/AMP-acid ligase II
VCLTHAAVCANLDAVGDAARLTAADHVLSWLPLYHDMGLIGGLGRPVRGTAVRIVDRTGAEVAERVVGEICVAGGSLRPVAGRRRARRRVGRRGPRRQPLRVRHRR